MSDYHFEKCSSEAIENVKTLLKKSNLPYADIDSHYGNFIIANENNKIIGVIGLESYQNTGLLRSLAVELSYRNTGLGKVLVNKMLSYSGSIQIKELYLLTTTAEKFFEKFGFYSVERNNAPAKIKTTMEFKSICPVSAICMKKEM